MKKSISIFILILVFSACETVEVKKISEPREIPEHKEVSEEMDISAPTLEETPEAVRPISSEEEYYLGRAVAARILSAYPLLRDQELTEYVNFVGQSVALHSDKPFIYGGYNFAILDTNEINAFACPGGTIFITKGMMRAVRNEDELAGVLAHEVAHINHRDGISAVKESRWKEAVDIIGTRGDKKYGSRDLAGLVAIFEDSIDDVFMIVVEDGYSQSQEYRADETALVYLERAGYDPGEFKLFIERLIELGKTSEGVVLKIHPATTDRLENVIAHMPSGTVNTSIVNRRTMRFKGIVQ